MMVKRRCAVVAGVAAAILGVFARAALAEHRQAAQYSARELRELLLSMQGKIKSLRVIYESGPHTVSVAPAGTGVHRVVVVKAPYSVYHVGSHRTRLHSFEDDPYQQRAFVTRDRLYNEFTWQRRYFATPIRPDDALPGSLPKEFYFIATGIWPLTGRRAPRPNGQPYMLPDVAESDAFSQVRPEQELVGSRWCHVLESPGYDVLWIDVPRGCTLMKRETSQRRGGPIVQRIELSDHVEVKPGIWLPKQFRNIQFDHRAETDVARAQPIIDATAIVAKMSVNDVDDSEFVFWPRPGSVQYWSNGEGHQVVPGGYDHLDDLVGWMNRNAEGRTEVSRHPHWSAVAAAMLFIVLCEVQRGVHKRKSRAAAGRCDDVRMESTGK